MTYKIGTISSKIVMELNEKVRLLTLLPISFRTVGRIYSLNNIFRSMITEVYWMNRLLALNRPLLSINVNSARYYRFLENSFGKIKAYKGQGINFTLYQYQESEYYGSKIDIGNGFTAALTDNGIRCIGNNTDGQCAQPPEYFTDSLILGKFKDVACGERHTLILKNNGSVYSFGYSTALGYTTKQKKNPIPTLIPNLPSISTIVAGDNHSVFLTTSGKVYTCGSNEYGQLGDGSLIDRILPTEVVFSRRVVEVSANSRSTFFLLENGEGYITGYNVFIDAITTEPQRVLLNELLLHAEIFEGSPIRWATRPRLVYTTIQGDTYESGNHAYGIRYSNDRSVYDYVIINKNVMFLSYSNTEIIQNISSRYGYSYTIT